MVRFPQSGSAKGFTLIELLIIIGIIGFLASAILVSVDPVKRIQDARNAKRWSEVNAILNAILTKQVDDRATYSGAAAAPIITHATNSQVIVRTAPTAGDCDAAPTKPLCPTQTVLGAGVDCVAQLSGSVTALENLNPTYIAELPLDPTNTVPATGPGIGDDNTGYYIHRTNGNRIEIGSCYPDQSADIKVKR